MNFICIIAIALFLTSCKERQNSGVRENKNKGASLFLQPEFELKSLNPGTLIEAKDTWKLTAVVEGGLLKLKKFWGDCSKL